MKKEVFKFFTGCIILILASGCVSDVIHHPGFVSTKVFGTLHLKGKHTDIKPFVLAIEHNQTFFKMEEESLKEVSVKLIYPDEKGNYEVRFSNSAVQLDLMFIARDHYLVSSRFSRTLGIETYEYNPTLTVDPLWKRNFDFSLKPILSQYIVEKRFNLPDKDQYFLGQWLNSQDEIPEN
ncbi:MAG: hypothetical protein GY786_19530 [Proteobacteria bacterium]|nr:hypothetical protein [Pseudomonadota bacterium]